MSEKFTDVKYKKMIQALKGLDKIVYHHIVE